MQKGFTLIELLVVLAIIGILASVILASFHNARDDKKLTDEAYCNKHYATSTVDNLPAKCLKYFGVGAQLKTND